MTEEPTPKPISTITILLLYLGAWIILVSLGAIPFPDSLFLWVVFLFIFPLSLLTTGVTRMASTLMVQFGIIQRSLNRKQQRTLTLTTATLLIAVVLFSAEDAMRNGLKQAAFDLPAMMDEDVPEGLAREFSERFEVTGNRILDSYFAGNELTFLEQKRAEKRIQGFAAAVSDGTLSASEITQLHQLYGLDATNP